MTEAQARLEGPGHVVLTMNGEQASHYGHDDHAAMGLALGAVKGLAAHQGQRVRVLTDAETLLVEPNGAVIVADPVPAPAPAAPPEAPVQVAVQAPAPTQPPVPYGAQSVAQGRAAGIPQAPAPTYGGVPAQAPNYAAPVQQQPAPAQGPAIGSDEGQPMTRREMRTAGDFASTKPESKAAPASIGWRGTSNRVFGTKLAPGAAEAEERQLRMSIQRGLLGHKTVAFVNLKGGSTKTTVTALAAATVGRVRAGNTLAWDNNENKGTLGDRTLSASHDHTAVDLLDHIDDFARPENAPNLVNYVRPQGEDKYHVLASQDRGSSRPVIDGPSFSRLHKALRMFYHLMFVDTGNASNAATWQAAVEAADELVVVAMNKEDSAKTAASTIDDLIAQGHGEKVRRGIAVITQPRQPDAERLARLEEHLRANMRDVVVVPFDPSLDDGDDIVYEKLQKKTRDAYLRVVSAIVDGL